jgi:hypothetical protein
MAKERKPDRISYWTDILVYAGDFVPTESGLALFACIAAGFFLLVIEWALSMMWGNLRG